MIPKIIHYVWLGRKQLSLETRSFIKTWKMHMPDYEIKCWNEDSFDCNSIPWVREAIEHKMWAFAADYIRLYALYYEGGIYLDTDVEVLRSFDTFLYNSFFSSTEVHPGFETLGKPKLDENYKPIITGDAIPNFGILSAIMGAEKGNRLIGDCLNYYTNLKFINTDGTMFVKIIIPDILGIQAVKYGFRYIDETQELNYNMKIYNSSVLVGAVSKLTKESYAIHYCEGTWRQHWWPRRKRIMYWITKKIKNLFGIKQHFNEHL